MRICKAEDCSRVTEGKKLLCEPCKLERVAKRTEAYIASRKKVRICRGCEGEVPETEPHSARYCSDTCRPTFKPSKVVETPVREGSFKESFNTLKFELQFIARELHIAIELLESKNMPSTLKKLKQIQKGMK